MEEAFQTYEQYSDWLLKNWQTSRELDCAIINSGLVIEKTNSCNGEVYRSLTKEEFLNKENDGFIQIPKK